jgi:hypothetical protein
MDHQSFFRDFSAFRGWFKNTAPTALDLERGYITIWLKP